MITFSFAISLGCRREVRRLFLPGGRRYDYTLTILSSLSSAFAMEKEQS
jgi:hypothetical protein